MVVKRRRRKSVEWRRVVVERGLKTEMTSGKAMILIAPIIHNRDRNRIL